MLLDRKVPETNTRTRAAVAPGLSMPGLVQESRERAGLMAPSPAKKGLSNTVRDLVA